MSPVKMDTHHSILSIIYAVHLNLQSMETKRHVVIIGGGFAGLNLAMKIRRGNYSITLVDRNNYMFFPPLLYQVATGFLEPSNISYPYRKMLQRRMDVRFKLGELQRINPERGTVALDTGELSFDYLVIATGTKTNYFGMMNVSQWSLPMKTLNDALELRNHYLSQLEGAVGARSNREELAKRLTVVIAGGGPTGVEVAGMLAEMRTSVLRKDYPELEGLEDCMKIYLVDGASQLLSPMSKHSQAQTLRALQHLNVEIILEAQVKDYSGGVVSLSNGQSIRSENLIWAAGVVSSTFEGLPEECFGRGKRLLCDEYHRLLLYPNVFAIGDTSIQMHESAFPGGHPQVAQVALQQGANLARNFNRIKKKQEPIAFRYKDKGSMAIIGRNKAVADLPSGLHFKGFFAWFLWVFVHLFSLVRFRNRVLTLYNWIVAYVTKDQALRLIIRPRR
jgi:NADH:ubiquinone reductase (H+-translocating)